ncbi:MAG: glycosyltransferase [Chitinophagaceae bacterium]|nr:MAG: glycosyltransferase [Chitinophagaceae bacterium]
MLKRTPGTPPPILPTKAVDRPLWSIMIPVYNCGRFLPQALNSVLIQFQHNEQVQIEVVDDASTDLDVQSLVSEIGGGRIGYYRQPHNVGSLRNFETCINRSTGKYIHLLHGDDYLSPGFYAEVERLFEQFPEAGSLCTGFTQVTECGKFICNSTIQLSEPGIIENWLEQIACNQKLQPPAVVVKREVYEELGSFFAVHYGEDWLMWVRIAAAYPVVHSPKKLAHYRVHDSNISSDALINITNTNRH